METRGLAVFKVDTSASGAKRFIHAASTLRLEGLEHLKRLRFDRETQYNVNSLARRLRRKRARSRGLSRKVLGLPDFAPAARNATAGPRLHGWWGGKGPEVTGTFWWALCVMEIPRLWLAKATSLPCPSFGKVQIQHRGGPQSLLAHTDWKLGKGDVHACALITHALRLTRSARSSHLEGYVSCFGMEKGTLERLGLQAVKKEGKKGDLSNI